MSEGSAIQPMGRIHDDGPDDGLRAVRSDTGVVLCGSCGRISRCRLGLRRESLQADDVVISEIECPRDNVGGPNVAVGHALLLRGEFVVTGTLQVKFVKPVPVERPLIGRAREVGREGRRVFVEANIVLPGTDVVVASAEATMVRRPADHFKRHEEWLSGLNGGDR